MLNLNYWLALTSSSEQVPEVLQRSHVGDERKLNAVQQILNSRPIPSTSDVGIQTMNSATKPTASPLQLSPSPSGLSCRLDETTGRISRADTSHFDDQSKLRPSSTDAIHFTKFEAAKKIGPFTLPSGCLAKMAPRDSQSGCILLYEST